MHALVSPSEPGTVYNLRTVGGQALFAELNSGSFPIIPAHARYLPTEAVFPPAKKSLLPHREGHDLGHSSGDFAS